MSSPGLPTLVLDLRRRRGERLVASGALLLVALSALSLLSIMGVWVILLMLAVCLPLIAIGFWRAGWFGGAHSLVRITWGSDGRWRLACATGEELDGELLPQTRMSPVAIWLRWSVSLPAAPVPRLGRSQTRRTGTLLLFPGDLSRADYRRLLVRLRLDRSECAPAATRASS